MRLRAPSRISFGVKSAISILVCLRIANRLIHHHEKIVAYLDAAIGADKNLVASPPWKLHTGDWPDLDHLRRNDTYAVLYVHRGGINLERTERSLDALRPRIFHRRQNLRAWDDFYGHPASSGMRLQCATYRPLQKCLKALVEGLVGCATFFHAGLLRSRLKAHSTASGTSVSTCDEGFSQFAGKSTPSPSNWAC